MGKGSGGTRGGARNGSRGTGHKIPTYREFMTLVQNENSRFDHSKEGLSATRVRRLFEEKYGKEAVKEQVTKEKRYLDNGYGKFDSLEESMGYAIQQHIARKLEKKYNLRKGTFSKI